MCCLVPYAKVVCNMHWRRWKYPHRKSYNIKKFYKCQWDTFHLGVESPPDLSLLAGSGRGWWQALLTTLCWGHNFDHPHLFQTGSAAMLDCSWNYQETPFLTAVNMGLGVFPSNFKVCTNDPYRHRHLVISRKRLIWSSKHCVKVEESQLGWLGCFGWAGKSGSALGLLLTDFGWADRC